MLIGADGLPPDDAGTSADDDAPSSVVPGPAFSNAWLLPTSAVAGADGVAEEESLPPVPGSLASWQAASASTASRTALRRCSTFIGHLESFGSWRRRHCHVETGALGILRRRILVLVTKLHQRHDVVAGLHRGGSGEDFLVRLAA